MFYSSRLESIRTWSPSRTRWRKKSRSTSVSFTVPPEMAPHIQGMEVVLGQATVPRCHCASISYGDIMEITFAGTQAETDTERDFFRFLVREGIPVRIESNR